MEYTIPDIIQTDAKERGFAGIRFGGEYDGVPYFYYLRDTKSRYAGLPSVVRLIDDTIEDVTSLPERLRAYDYAIEHEK